MPRLFTGSGNSAADRRVAATAARRIARRALDRSGKLSPDAALHRRHRRRARRTRSPAARPRAAPAFELRLDGLSSFGGRKPRAVVATVDAVAGADGAAGRARAADAAGRARARGPQIHAACHAGAAARRRRAARSPIISRRAAAVPLGAVPRRRASCCSRRAPRSAAGRTWSRPLIRSVSRCSAGLARHSGAEPTGPARRGRRDDSLREEPGIHNHSSRRTRAENLLRAWWLWIPDLPPSKSAVADLDFIVSISGRPEIDGNPE